MNFRARFLIMLCVFAGLGGAMVHGSLHAATDECASHCGSDHGGHGDSHDHDQDHEGGSMPHHHVCCHIPSADRATDSVSLPISFQCVLLEIAADRALVPDEPVFALDKPPLI